LGYDGVRFFTGMVMNSRLFSSILVIGFLAGCSKVPPPAPSASPVAQSMDAVAIDAKAQSKIEKKLVLSNSSTPGAIAVAVALKKAKAKVYTAYWCPHCHDQGEAFGKEAFAIVAPVECAKDGQGSQMALCDEAAKKSVDTFGFPTWEINGRFYPGVKTVDELGAIVGVGKK
jgi:hypothetical protein